MNLVKTYFKSGVKQVTAFLALFLISTFTFAAEGENGGISFSLSDTEIVAILVGIAVVLLIFIAVVADVIKKLAGSKDLWTQKIGNKGLPVIITVLLSLGASSAFAAGNGESESMIVLSDTAFWMLVSLDILLLCILFAMLYVLKNLIKSLKGASETTEPDVFEEWTQKLTDSVPVEREEEVMTDHEYDGIRELDNNLPPWWVGMFYVTIIFSVIYMGYYHFFGVGDLSAAEYEKEMAKAEKQKQEYMERMANSVDENNVELLTDATKIANGKEIFMQYCKTCHGEQGEGMQGLGPNLTDQYWKHGGSISDVFKTIKYGVPEKGMISWESQLSPSKIQEVSSYIMTLQGTNPPNAKEPEGELYKPDKGESEEEQDVVADTSAVAGMAADSTKME